MEGKQVNVKLPLKLLGDMDRVRAEEWQSRAEFIRRAIREKLERLRLENQ